MSATQPPADAVEAVREWLVRLLYEHDPMCGEVDRAYTAEKIAPLIHARFEATLRPAIIRECAAHLDSYAGGHYMAESCADALRELAQREEPSRGT